MLPDRLLLFTVINVLYLCEVESLRSHSYQDFINTALSQFQPEYRHDLKEFVTEHLNPYKDNNVRTVLNDWSSILHGSVAGGLSGTYGTKVDGIPPGTGLSGTHRTKVDDIPPGPPYPSVQCSVDTLKVVVGLNASQEWAFRSMKF